MVLEGEDREEEEIGDQVLAVEDQEKIVVTGSGTEVKNLEDSGEMTNKKVAREDLVVARMTTRNETRRPLETLDLRPNHSVITSTIEK